MTNVVTREERLTRLAMLHDLNAISQPATRVIRMGSGQVVASGTAGEILGELEEVA